MTDVNEVLGMARRVCAGGEHRIGEHCAWCAKIVFAMQTYADSKVLEAVNVDPTCGWCGVNINTRDFCDECESALGEP